MWFLEMMIEDFLEKICRVRKISFQRAFMLIMLFTSIPGRKLGCDYIFSMLGFDL